MFPRPAPPFQQAGFPTFSDAGGAGDAGDAAKTMFDLLRQEGENPAREAAEHGITHAVILADIFTEFLDPLTRTVSPLLLQVGNVPIIDHMLHHLFTSGLKSVTIVSSVQCELLDQYITHISRWQMKYNFFDGFDSAGNIFGETEHPDGAENGLAHPQGDQDGDHCRGDSEGGDADVVAEMEGRQQPLLTVNLVRSTSRTQVGAFRQASDKIPSSQAGRAFLLICGPVLSNANLSSLSFYHAAFPPSWVITPVFQHLASDSVMRPIDSTYTVFRDYESGRLVHLVRDKAPGPGEQPFDGRFDERPEDSPFDDPSREPADARKPAPEFGSAGGEGTNPDWPAREHELASQARARRAGVPDQVLPLNLNEIFDNAAEARTHARRMGRRGSSSSSPGLESLDGGGTEDTFDSTHCDEGFGREEGGSGYSTDGRLENPHDTNVVERSDASLDGRGDPNSPNGLNGLNGPDGLNDPNGLNGPNDPYDSDEPEASGDTNNSIAFIMQYFTKKDEGRAERAGARAAQSAIISAKRIGSGPGEEDRGSSTPSSQAVAKELRTVEHGTGHGAGETLARHQSPAATSAPAGSTAAHSEGGDLERQQNPVTGPSTPHTNPQEIPSPSPIEQSFPLFPAIPGTLSSLEVSRTLCCTNMFLVSPSFFRRILSNSDFHGSNSILSIVTEKVGSAVHSQQHFVGSYILPELERAVRVDSLRSLREASNLYLKGYLSPYSPQANLYYINGARTAFSKVTGRGFELFRDVTCTRDASARLMGTLMLGKHTRLQSDCLVASSVLGNYVQVDSGSFVSGSQIGSNSHINARAVIQDALLSSFCIVDPYVVLPRGSVVTDTTNVTHRTVYAAIRATFQIMFGGRFDVYWCLCLTLATVRSSHMSTSDFQLMRLLDRKALGVEARDAVRAPRAAFPYPKNRTRLPASTPHTSYSTHLAQIAKGSRVSTGKFLLSCATSIYNFLLGNVVDLSTYIISFFIPPVYIGRQSSSIIRTQYYNRCIDAFEQKAAQLAPRGVGAHLIPRSLGRVPGAEFPGGSILDGPQTLSFASEGFGTEDERYDPMPQTGDAGDMVNDSTLTSSTLGTQFEPDVLPAVFDVRLDKIALPGEEPPSLPCEDSGLSQSSSQSSTYVESNMLAAINAAPAEKSIAALLRQTAEPMIKAGSIAIYVIPSYAVMLARARVTAAQKGGRTESGMFEAISLGSTLSVAGLGNLRPPLQRVGSGLFDTIPLGPRAEAGLTVGVALRQGEAGGGSFSGLSTPISVAGRLVWGDEDSAETAVAVEAALEKAQRDSMTFMLLNGYYYIPPAHLREILDDPASLEGVDILSERLQPGTPTGLAHSGIPSTAERAFVENIPLTVQGFPLPELDTDYFVAEQKPWISTEATTRYLLAELDNGRPLGEQTPEDMRRMYTCLGDAREYVSSLYEKVRRKSIMSPQLLVSQNVSRAMQDSRFERFPALRPRIHIPGGDIHPPTPDPALLKAGEDLLHLSRLNITSSIKMSGDRELQTNSTVMAQYVLQCILLITFFGLASFQGLNENGECVIPDGVDLMRLSETEFCDIAERFYHALDFWTQPRDNVFGIQPGDQDDRSEEQLISDFRETVIMSFSDFITACIESGALTLGHEGAGEGGEEGETESSGPDNEKESCCGESSNKSASFSDGWGQNVHTGYTDDEGEESEYTEDSEENEENEEEETEEIEEASEGAPEGASEGVAEGSSDDAPDRFANDGASSASGHMNICELMRRLTLVLIQFELTDQAALNEWADVLEGSPDATDRLIYKHIVSPMDKRKESK